MQEQTNDLKGIWLGQLLVESEATYVRTITKPELIPDPLGNLCLNKVDCLMDLGSDVVTAGF